jgi:hypothetical protein
VAPARQVPTDIVFMTGYPAQKRIRFLTAYLAEQEGRLEPEEEAEAAGALRAVSTTAALAQLTKPLAGSTDKIRPARTSRSGAARCGAATRARPAQRRPAGALVRCRGFRCGAPVLR